MRPRVTGPELMTPREVCALFRVNPKTLWTWDAAGKLRGSPDAQPAAAHDARLRASQ